MSLGPASSRIGAGSRNLRPICDRARQVHAAAARLACLRNVRHRWHAVHARGPRRRCFAFGTVGAIFPTQAIFHATAPGMAQRGTRQSGLRTGWSNADTDGDTAARPSACASGSASAEGARQRHPSTRGCYSLRSGPRRSTGAGVWWRTGRSGRVGLGRCGYRGIQLMFGEVESLNVGVAGGGVPGAPYGRAGDPYGLDI